MLKFFFYLIAYLPNTWAQRLAVVIGNVLSMTDNRDRRVAATNIALCFSQLSAQEQSALVKRTLVENAKTLLELPGIFIRGGEYAISLIRAVNGIEHYQAAVERQQGVILLAPHLGNWELTSHFLNQYAPITAMFAPPKIAFLNDIIRRSRQSTGVVLIPADDQGVRTLFKQLKNGAVIGLLPDQIPKHDNAGVYAPFMGHDAFTMTLVNHLAHRTGATVLLTFAERLPIGKGYRLHIFPASENINHAERLTAAKAMNEDIAACVSLVPQQYQWTYKRFKKQPDGKNSPYH